MKNKKKLIILSIAIISTILAIALYSMFNLSEKTFDGTTSKVKMGTIQNTIEETGTVYSKRVNTFYSDMSQRVETLNVSVGDKVKKGSIILTYENNYDLEIERANKQIEAITASYNESVKGADFQEISNMKLQINTIENNLSFAKSSFEKLKALYESGAVSQVEYEEAQYDVTALENQLQEAKNNYNLLIKGVSSNIKKQYEAQVEEIMIQIKILEKSIEQSSIKAEFDGVITELNVHQGGMTQAGVVVVEIQDENNLGAYVEVLAEDAEDTVVGMPFVINSKGGNEELKVSRIYPKAKTKVSDLGVEQKRVRIEADLGELEENHGYKIGSEMDVVIVLDEKENVLLVDKDAVYDKSGKQYVTVIENNAETEREVTTGIKDDDNIEITSGLKENEVVLIEY
ncbi:efflux RND transporter periplasmic adaptor subunit [Sedimentibacter sp. B4]|uniref:efflux RND transporter periplasmic adaptor subunit n=1 Tax=Sedimentibacter sp. B4 TaxID=304766 RepID=UPI0002DB602B|nr:HlyD family efflux transporter periplasmic adaptor subunit [Sedimentibacter sp. B4]